MKFAIFAADIGAVQRGHFGWASDPAFEMKDHRSIEHFADSIVEAAANGSLIALGVECPLFIPCPDEVSSLGKARKGEGGLPWSGQVGATVAIHGLHQLCWVLRRIRKSFGEDAKGTLDWSEFQAGSHALFVWEAFVSGGARPNDHVADAVLAVRTFLESQFDPQTPPVVSCSTPVSLAGMALLWSGWSNDIRLLRNSTVVVKAKRSSEA